MQNLRIQSPIDLNRPHEQKTSGERAPESFERVMERTQNAERAHNTQRTQAAPPQRANTREPTRPTPPPAATSASPSSAAASKRADATSTADATARSGRAPSDAAQSADAAVNDDTQPAALSEAAVDASLTQTAPTINGPAKKGARKSEPTQEASEASTEDAMNPTLALAVTKHEPSSAASPSVVVREAPSDPAVAARSASSIKKATTDATAIASTDDDKVQGKSTHVAGADAEKKDAALDTARDLVALTSSATPRVQTSNRADVQTSLDALSSAATQPNQNAAQQLTAPATAGANANTPIYSAAHTTVSTPLGRPGFADEFGDKLIVFSKRGIQNARFDIAPEQLGPVSVSIALNGNAATLTIGAAQEATRQLLNDALPRLRELFSANGLQLTQAQVGDQSAQQQAAHRQAQSEGLRQARALAVGAIGPASNSLGAAADDARPISLSAALRARLIDIFA